MVNKQEASYKWPLALFTIGVFMAGLDNGIISTALTTINASFNVSPSWGAWSITLYTLGVAISVPIIGKFSDNYGRKRLFIIEVIIFGIGSLLVALSPNFVFLLIARFIQAIGGGGIFIIGSSYILSTLPKEKQGRALGLLGGMHGLAAVIGPSLGAVILSVTGSWHWMFFINIPIAIFLVIFGFLKIGETKPETSKPLDIIGTTLLSTGILALMYGITKLDSTAFIKSIMDPSVASFLLIGIALFVLLIIYEKRLEERGGDPILAYSLMRTRLFQITLFLGLLSGGFLAGIIFIPSFVQQVLNIPAENAGYWLTPLAIASGIGAGLGGYLADKYGPVQSIMVSGVLGIVGFLLFPFWVDGAWTFIIASIIAGVGLGILLGAPLNMLVGASAKEDAKGSALGTLSLVRQIGLTLFPTIYAGFLTGGFTKIEPAVNDAFGSEVLGFKDADGAAIEGDYGSLMNQVEDIEDPTIYEKVLEIVSASLKSGFDQMFITSSILALFVLFAGIYLRGYTKELKL